MAGSGQKIRSVAVDGHDIAWAATGSGPPLVIGGWWLSHLELDWHDPLIRDFLARLAAHRLVVRYDWPGQGLSGPAAGWSHTLEDEVRVLGAVVDAMGEGPVALLGGSSGGPVAAAYAARRPDRVARLVLYGSYADGSGIASMEARESLVALVARQWGLGSRVLADIFLPRATSTERDAFAKLQRTSATADAAARTLAAVYHFDVRAELPQISVPTLALHRAADRAIPVALGRELADLIPGARYVELNGDEHFPWRGDSGSVLRPLLEFLGHGGPPTPVPGPLTVREREVLQLVARGLSDREIARTLVLSPHTVHRHIANVRAKLELPSRAAAAAYAVRTGLI